MVKKYVVIGILVIFAFIFLLPIIPVEEAYTEIEPYQESYSDVEQYNRKAKYSVLKAVLSEEWSLSLGVYHTLSVEVQNTDDYGGAFTVRLELFDVDGLFRARNVQKYVGAGNTETFSTDFDTSLGQDVRGEYKITAPTVTDQKTVTKTRTAYREVTKYRTVNKSIVDILLGR